VTTSENNCRVILIAAIGRNRELGKDNSLLWRLAADMAFFKSTTTNHWVIMGRKSYESLPPKFRPLPNRVNVVITRDHQFQAEGCQVFHSIEAALEAGRKAQQEEVFIIGGAQIYGESLRNNLIDEMYLTHVQADFPNADVFLAAIDASQWDTSVVSSFIADDKNQFDGEILHYVSKRN
jgi:dihydrofolate reductase